MKNGYKIIISVVSLSVLLLIADWVIGTWSEKMYNASKYGMYHRQLYCLKDANEDILIMGSSRAAHHYVPQIFEDSLQMSCYNAGSEGQCIYYHYTLLASMIERGARPKVILYEVMDLDAEVSRLSSFTLDAALDRMAPHYGEFEAIDELFGKKDWKEHMKLFSKTFRYNSKIVQTIKCNYIPWPEDKGYEALVGKMNIKLLDKEGIGEGNATSMKVPEVEEQKLEYVRKFIALCKTNDIKLLFMYSPYYNYSLPYGVRLIKEIAVKENVPFYDYASEGQYNDPELFRDRMHLNDDGAKMYTTDVIRKITRIIGMGGESLIK